MAHHTQRGHSRDNTFGKISHYAATAGQVIGAGKALYDTGRVLWGAAQAAAPYLAAGLAAL